jgi:flagellar M-ring protein FliF
VVPAPGSERQQAAGVLVHRREALQRQTRSAPALRVADAEAAAAREDGQYNSTVETNFEVSRRVEQIVTSPGSIRRVSVGIVLPRSVGRDVAEQIERLVTMAAGLEIERRGDAIAVQSLDQATPAQAPAAAPASSGQGWQAGSADRPHAAPDLPPGAWLAAAAALGLLLGLAVALTLRKNRREVALAEINRSLREVRP